MGYLLEGRHSGVPVRQPCRCPSHPVSPMVDSGAAFLWLLFDSISIQAVFTLWPPEVRQPEPLPHLGWMKEK